MGPKYDGELLIGIRPENVTVQVHAVRHAHFHVAIDDDVVFSLRC